jgi:hypothetical protein
MVPVNTSIGCLQRIGRNATSPVAYLQMAVCWANVRSNKGKTMTFAPQHPNYPPRNRLEQELEFPWIEVTDAKSTLRTSPNALIGCVLWGSSGEQPCDRAGNPIDEIDKGAKVFNPLALAPRHHVPSLLSGAPSVQYVSDDIAIDLAPDELLRLIAFALRPAEYATLRAHFGMFFEIHDDFYDEFTGQAVGKMSSLIGDNPPPALRGPRM